MEYEFKSFLVKEKRFYSSSTRFTFLTLKLLRYSFCLTYQTHTKISRLSIFTQINFRYLFIKSVSKPVSCNNCFL